MSEAEQELETKIVAETLSTPQLDSSILASYKILAIVGEGGFGTVYKAEHRKLPGPVALKVVRKDLARSETAYKRLGQEARAITTLNHENIVSVKEFGTGNEGSAYLVMSYIEGESLEAVLKKQTLSVDTTLDLASQICNGLIHAHGKGILHRDLKPGNIMLVRESGSRPLAKIVDFGIAKIRDEAAEQQITQTGDIVGSPYYMSPEQCQGFPIDERTDVYSLACVIFEMISGQVPFKGANAIQTIFKHLNDAPPSLKALAPGRDIPQGLEAVLLKALEKDPGRRYQSIQALKDDLELVRSGKAPAGLSPKKVEKKSASEAPYRLLTIGFLLMFLIVLLSSLQVLHPHFLSNPWNQKLQTASDHLSHGNYQLAKATLLQALKEANNGAASAQDKANIYGALGNLCRNQDSFVESAQYYKEAAKYAEAAGDKGNLSSYLDDLCLSQNETGDTKEALKNGTRALELKLSLYGENSFLTSNSMQKLAKVKYTVGDYAGAEELFRRALQIEHNTAGPRSSGAATVEWLLAKTLLAEEKLDEAKKHYDECISIRDELLGVNDKTTATIRSKFTKLMNMKGPRLDTMLISTPSIQVIQNNPAKPE